MPSFFFRLIRAAHGVADAAVSRTCRRYSGIEGADKLFTALFAQLGPLDQSNFGVDHLTVNADTMDVFLVWNCESANLKKVTDTFLFDSAGVIRKQDPPCCLPRASVRPRCLVQALVSTRAPHRT